ncbi:hypothetical protein AURDEDRAFT_93093 [Auricularia subglabra TFB-10046 SS5]|uniref:Uncharacterized protein n=1 Tax=Auricularia subglabra (strain TFB-10046 / SS5) TaxID=717982 RepID=J0WRS5_AURST|nr:hypothetical protein AURDEDRAFT_93093 [Auricularia subglabra TFB-10046 SS5]
MFGESDSDSPHVGSPWDSLLSSSASLEFELKHRLQRSCRLSPEIEEGNVEYKLKLIDPTPERFARLVTQLKWRLLEGGGQAYYELGVADSGQLVGLCRTELEATLETLEAMAGEIGASVIIVKEIEVPAMRTLKEGLLGAAIGGGVDFSQVDGAMRLPRRRHLLLMPSDDSDGETETPETDMTSTDEPLTADERAESAGDLATIWPSKLAPVLGDEDTIFDIEVSAVYKPLPSLRRTSTSPAAPRKDKSAQREKKATRPNPDPVARAIERKAKRDARRDNRRREILGDDDSSPRTVFDMSAVAAALPQPYDEPEPPRRKGKPEVPTDSGPLLIVEALVVRKPANDEVFMCLDDLGFLV